jgi:hypothetical protein
MMMPLRFWMAHDTAEIMALMSDFLPPGKWVVHPDMWPD